MKVAKNASKMVGSFYRSRKYLSPSSILYLYKSQIRSTMEYCCHVWTGASERSLSSLDSVQRRLLGLVGLDLYATLQPLLIAVMLLAFPSYIVTFMGNAQTNLTLLYLHFVFSNVRLATLMTVLNALTSSKLLMPTTNSTKQASSHEPPNCGTPYRQKFSPTDTTSIRSNKM